MKLPRKLLNFFPLGVISILGAFVLCGCEEHRESEWPSVVRVGVKVEFSLAANVVRDALGEHATTVSNRRAVPTVSRPYEVVHIEGAWLHLKAGKEDFWVPKNQIVALAVVE